MGHPISGGLRFLNPGVLRPPSLRSGSGSIGATALKYSARSKRSLDSCFPTQAELGWGTQFRGDCDFLKRGFFDSPSLRSGSGSIGATALKYSARSKRSLDSCFPTQAELGWGTQFRGDCDFLKRGFFDSPSLRSGSGSIGVTALRYSAKRSLGPCFPTQAELGWGTQFRGDCDFL